MVYVVLLMCVFFKQKTAYEMRISDWSSDVCSSDLVDLTGATAIVGVVMPTANWIDTVVTAQGSPDGVNFFDMYDGVAAKELIFNTKMGDRKSVVSGKSVSVRVDLGGRRIITKKKKTHNNIRLIKSKSTQYRT